MRFVPRRSIWLVFASLAMVATSACDQGSSSGTSSATPASTTAVPASAKSTADDTAKAMAAPPAMTNDDPRNLPNYGPGGTPLPVQGGKGTNLPPIKFDPPVIELGLLKPNTTVMGKTQIRNVSDKPVKLLMTKASCTCTTVELSNVEIPAGGSVPLEAGYRASGVFGFKRSSVRVAMEGYELVELFITADVSLPVKAEPSYIAALKESKGEFVVESLDKSAFQILAVNGKPPVFADGFNPATDQPRSSYRLPWDLSSYDKTTCTDAQGNPIPVWWIVETDHPACPIFDLEIRHECARRARPGADATWMTIEKRSMVGLVHEGESAEIDIDVTWLPNKARNLPVNSVRSLSPNFSAELIGTETSGDKMHVRAKITPMAGYRGLLYGQIELGNGAQKELYWVVGTVRD